VKNFVTREFYLSSTILESVLLVNVMRHRRKETEQTVWCWIMQCLCSSIQKSSKK